MFKSTKEIIRKNKFTMLFSFILLVISLIIFFITIITGDIFILSEHPKIEGFLIIFRMFLYILIFALLYKKTPENRRLFLTKLTIGTILIYELIFVFKLPVFLFEMIGA